MYDWGDLRHFLAVARSGSTLSASRALKVSQPTVVRRVAALEQELGVTLFDRRPTGYVCTSVGEALLSKAELVEAAAIDAQETAQAEGRHVGGDVRISVFEIFAITFLAQILRELHLQHPQIHIDLDFSDLVRDLNKGEADIAIRSGKQLSGGGLVCRRLVEERWAYYCSRRYAEQNGVPRSPDELNGHVIIGDGTEDFWPEFQQWRDECGIRNTIDIHHGSTTALLAAIRSGIGIAILPELAALTDSDLVLCMRGPNTGHSLWLVTSERLRHRPSIRLVMDFLAERIVELARPAEAATA